MENRTELRTVVLTLLVLSSGVLVSGVALADPPALAARPSVPSGIVQPAAAPAASVLSANTPQNAIADQFAQYLRRLEEARARARPEALDLQYRSQLLEAQSMVINAIEQTRNMSGPELEDIANHGRHMRLSFVNKEAARTYVVNSLQLTQIEIAKEQELRRPRQDGRTLQDVQRMTSKNPVLAGFSALAEKDPAGFATRFTPHTLESFLKYTGDTRAIGERALKLAKAFHPSRFTVGSLLAVAAVAAVAAHASSSTSAQAKSASENQSTADTAIGATIEDFAPRQAQRTNH